MISTKRQWIVEKCPRKLCQHAPNPMTMLPLPSIFRALTSIDFITKSKKLLPVPIVMSLL
ncbi:hypothetical protein ACHAWX_000094 [Stephanocyclus meneghinianus]